jgi:glycosyltransferase involved in cell wall biosynthesis
MKSGLITIVVPFLNHADYIESCWNNLQNQSYKNFELIFIDNGSTDGSNALAKKLVAKQSDKIKIIEESQKGIPFARNRGLKEASGEFIAFLDVDDRFADDKLERLIQALIKFPQAAMAYGQTLRIYSDSKRKIIQDTGTAVEGINLPPTLAIDWTKSFFRLPQTGATLVRTDAARSVGGFPTDLLLGNDDVGYHINLATKYPVVFLPFVAVIYFRHEKSEGARLNEVKSVHARYFDAHLKVTIPAASKYYKQTDEIIFLGYAQKALFTNYIEGFAKRNRFSFKDELQNNFFAFYRLLLPIYQVLPFSIAHFIYKVLRRIANMINSSKYPLK